MLETQVLSYGRLKCLFVIDVDECESPEANSCHPNALCTNTEGSYVCRCLRGYNGNGRNCTGKTVGKLPLLRKSPVFPAYIRTDAFTYVFKANVFSPTLDYDECADEDQNECDPNALCTNTEGSYVCRCLRGYEGDGRNCTGNFM